MASEYVPVEAHEASNHVIAANVRHMFRDLSRDPNMQDVAVKLQACLYGEYNKVRDTNED